MEKVTENKNLIRLLVGQLVTVFGSQIYTFALSYYILKTTGSGILFGVTLALSMLPQLLFAPIAGVMSDAISRKSIIVFTDLVSAVALIGGFVVSLFLGLEIYLIYLLMFLLASLSTFNSVALNAAIPNIATKQSLSKVNSMSQSVASFARITAPFVGGIVIVVWDIKMFLVVNAISFFVASFLESRIHFIYDIQYKAKKQNISEIKKGFLKNLIDGMKYCKENKIIYIIVTFMFVMNFLFHLGFSVPIPYIINNTLNLNAAQYGVIQGLTSAGAFMTSVIIAKKFTGDKVKKLLISSMLGMAIILVMMGLTTFASGFLLDRLVVYILFALLNFLFGGTIVASNISLMSILQSQSEDAYRGRIMGFMNMTRSIISPVAVLLSGVLLDYIKSFTLPLIGGTLLIFFVSLLSKRKELEKC